MTPVVVTQVFMGKPDGEPLARLIAVGETLIGELADVALAEGWASTDQTPTPKPKKGK